MWMPFAHLSKMLPQDRMRAAMGARAPGTLPMQGLQWNGTKGQLVGRMQAVRSGMHGLGLPSAIVGSPQTVVTPTAPAAPTFVPHAPEPVAPPTQRPTTSTLVADSPAPTSPSAQPQPQQQQAQADQYPQGTDATDTDWQAAREAAAADEARAMAEQDNALAVSEHENKPVPEANAQGPDKVTLVKAQKQAAAAAAAAARGGSSSGGTPSLLAQFSDAPPATKVVVVVGGVGILWFLKRALIK